MFISRCKYGGCSLVAEREPVGVFLRRNLERKTTERSRCGFDSLLPLFKKKIEKEEK